MGIQVSDKAALVSEILEYLESKGLFGHRQESQSPEQLQPAQQAPQKPQRQTVDVKTAAEIAGVSQGTMYTLARENQIPHIRVRGRVLFHRETIELWLRGELLAANQG